MASRQHLRVGICERVQEAMQPGELMIWEVFYGEWTDYLDGVVRHTLERQLVEESRACDDLDAEITRVTAAGGREQTFELHARRSDWLRHHYLNQQGDTTATALARVRGVVVTVDIAVKLLGGMSARHRSFLSLTSQLGMVDEVHHARDQLICLAAHIECLVCAGDKCQDLQQAWPGDCGSAVDGLGAHATSRATTEVWRFGREGWAYSLWTCGPEMS